MKLIAEKLFHTEYLPYILRKGRCVKYPDGDENIGKHKLTCKEYLKNWV